MLPFHSNKASTIVLVLCFLLSLPAAFALENNNRVIKVGSISTLSGPTASTDSLRAVKAYFDQVNALGGIKGRKLQLLSEDDKGVPEAAYDVANHLVEREGVVALIGNSSTVECTANAEYYARKGLISLPGTAGEVACFNSSAISPTNAGPYIGLGGALTFASETLHRKNLCAVLMNTPGMRPGYDEAISTWKKNSGRTLHLYEPAYPPGAPTAPYLRRVAEAGCEAVVFLGLEPWVIDWVRNAKKMGLKGIDWLFLTPAYTALVAESLGSDGEGIYAMSEFLPWSSRSPELLSWRESMFQGKVPLTSSSQGGYLAASVFVSVLKKIPGEINRETITSAFRKLEQLDTPLIGTPYSFGEKRRHNANRAIIPMVLRGGQWRIAHPDWITVVDKE